MAAPIRDQVDQAYHRRALSAGTAENSAGTVPQWNSQPAQGHFQPVTSKLRETPLFRVGIKPATESGLRKTSQAVVDKLVTVAREKVGAVLGAPDTATIEEAERHLAVFPGIAK